MKLSREEKEFIGLLRVGRLTTKASDGSLHVVPLCHVYKDKEILMATEMDSIKVKNLNKIREAAYVMDEYTEDWKALKGVMLRGEVRMIIQGPRFKEAVKLLYDKYPQYSTEAPIGEGKSVVLKFTPERKASWGFE